MKKVLLAVAMALPLAVLAVGWQVSAQDGNLEDPLPPDGEFYESVPGDEAAMWQQGSKMQEMMEKLGITEEQLDALKAGRTAHMKEMIEIGSKLKIAQIELRELMNEHGNDQAVLAKHNEINGIRSQMSDVRVRHHLAQRALFSAEQWDKVSKVFSVMKKRRSGRGFGQHSMRGGRQGYGGQRQYMSPRRGFGGGQGRMAPRGQ